MTAAGYVLVLVLVLALVLVRVTSDGPLAMHPVVYQYHQ